MATTMGKPKILVVDDEKLVRVALQQYFERQGYPVMVAEDAAEADQMVSQEQPQAVLLDVRLPDRSGIEVAREIHATQPQVGVIALTAYDDEAYILALAEAGVRGYLLKTATDAEIVAAVRAVAAGGSVFAAAVTEALLRYAREDVPPRDFGLTDREREVLRFVATGLTNRDIGRRMGISGRTVQAHLSHIFGKLAVASRTEAVTVGIRQGLLRMPREDAPQRGRPGGT